MDKKNTVLDNVATNGEKRKYPFSTHQKENIFSSEDKKIDNNRNEIDNYRTPINNYNTSSEDNQIIDKHKKELNEKFTPKKEKSILLSQSYERLGLTKKSKQVFDCGSYLEFVVPEDYSSSFRLHNANFCRDRLCPMCSWRKSKKIYSQISDIMNVIQNDYEFLFLTLTVQNCSGDDLSKTVTKLMNGWNKLQKRTPFVKAVKGSFRALEITHNVNYKSKSFNTYHPHFHVILAVSKRYFKTKQYINRDTWLKLWRESYGDNSITQVDIRKFKNKNDTKSGSDCSNVLKDLSSAVAEAAKYTVKDCDYILPNDLDLTDKTVSFLSSALLNRRLVSLTGCFKDSWNKLQLDDFENGDLIHLSNDDLRSDISELIVKYHWGVGAYKILSVEHKVDLRIDFDE